MSGGVADLEFGMWGLNRYLPVITETTPLTRNYYRDSFFTISCFLLVVLCLEKGCLSWKCTSVVDRKLEILWHDTPPNMLLYVPADKLTGTKLNMAEARLKSLSYMPAKSPREEGGDSPARLAFLVLLRSP